MLRAAFGAAAAAGLVVLAAGPATAAPVRIDYPLSGSSYLSGTDSTLQLGPGVLEATVDLSAGTLTADMQLPPATGSFKTLDLIPATATVEFIETEPTTGTVTAAGTETTSKIIIRITSLKIAGIPQLIGHHCQTKVPATIDLASEPGFHPILGGDVSGTYTVPKFEHCLLLTPIINLLIPGGGNEISLTLGQAQEPPA